MSHLRPLFWLRPWIWLVTGVAVMQIGECDGHRRDRMGLLFQREYKFVASTGTSVGTADNADGTQSVTYTNTDLGSSIIVAAGTNISSVGHAGSTWTVNAATQAGAVSSVTGAGSTSCSPTTGAVVCTTSNTVSNGLIGATTLTAHGPLVGEGTGAIVATAVGTAGQPFISNGPGVDPSFQSCNLAPAGSCITGVLGPLNGGSGVSGPTAHGIVVAEGSSAMVSTVCASGQVPMGVTSADPACTSAAGDVSGPYNGLVVGGIQGRNVANTAPATGAIYSWSGASWTPLAAGTTGQFLTGNTGAQPSWLTWASGFTSTTGISIPATGATTAVGSTTFTVPTGGAKANVSISFSIIPTAAPTNSQTFTYGLGVDTTASYSDSHAFTVPIPAPSTAILTAAPSEMWQTSLSAGSHTISPLVSSSVVTWTAAANQHVILTP